MPFRFLIKLFVVLNLYMYKLSGLFFTSTFKNSDWAYNNRCADKNHFKRFFFNCNGNDFNCYPNSSFFKMVFSWHEGFAKGGSSSFSCKAAVFWPLCLMLFVSDPPETWTSSIYRQRFIQFVVGFLAFIMSYLNNFQLPSLKLSNWTTWSESRSTGGSGRASVPAQGVVSLLFQLWVHLLVCSSGCRVHRSLRTIAHSSHMVSSPFHSC